MTATAGDALQARVQALVALYQGIAATRMRGLPLLNPVLQVQAIGFEPFAAPEPAEPAPAGPHNAPQPPHTGPAGAHDSIGAAAGATRALNPGAEVEAALGILITPWFMNLVWLPLQHLNASAQVGSKTARPVGHECFEFIAAHENGLGSYAACSLFSPMFEFASQQAALATGQAVLAHLRQPVLKPAPPAPAAPALPVPARRAFLFGRRPAAPGAAAPAAPPREAARRA